MKAQFKVVDTVKQAKNILNRSNKLMLLFCKNNGRGFWIHRGADLLVSGKPGPYGARPDYIPVRQSYFARSKEQKAALNKFFTGQYSIVVFGIPNNNIDYLDVYADWFDTHHISAYQEKAAKEYIDAEPAEIQLGVELEAEHTSIWSSNMPSKLKNRWFLHDVGSDPTVSGVEIRFNHPVLKIWKDKSIQGYIKDLADAGFNADRGEAGMHVHVSGPGMATAGMILGRDYNYFKSIVYPINDRMDNGKHWGLRGDCAYAKDFHGTIEFRCWRATMIPELFVRRIQFVNDMFKYMAKGLPLKDYFKRASKKEQENYVRMVELCTHHVYGLSAEQAIDRALNRREVIPIAQ